MSHKTVCIIGSGIGGLAVANILAKAGFQVTVYEKNNYPGGRMGQLKKQGFTFDTGPSWYLMPEVFTHYFSLFGKRAEDYYTLIRLDPAYKVFYEDNPPVIIQGSYDKNLATFEQMEVGAAQQLRKYINFAEITYSLALDYFLYNPFRRPFGLLHPKLIQKLPTLFKLLSQSLHAYTSKRFSNQKLQQILEYPSVFLGASPFEIPALYQLMSYLDFKNGVYYPKKQGMYTVAQALCELGEELGVKYVYNAPVTKIIANGRLARGVMVNNQFKPADIVVSNADLHFTENSLLDETFRSYSSQYWARKKTGPSALLLYIGIKGYLPQLEHHNLLFVQKWRENFEIIYNQKKWPYPASMYISKTTATDKLTAPPGHENVFVLVPLPSNKQMSSLYSQRFVDLYLQQLASMLKIDNLKQRIVCLEVRGPKYFNTTFHAWQNTALGINHTLQQTAFLRPKVVNKKLKNLYYVGADTQPGIGVPMCLISAQLVYKHLAGDWSYSRPQTIRQLV